MNTTHTWYAFTFSISICKWHRYGIIISSKMVSHNYINYSFVFGQWRYKLSRSGCASRAALTLRVQRMDLQLQRRILQMKLSRGGHDLDLADHIHYSITAQHLSGHWHTHTHTHTHSSDGHLLWDDGQQLLITAEFPSTYFYVHLGILHKKRWMETQRCA